ncbi:Protein-disulfide isomerase [Sphingomonas laterariae]|uniref:Protein-disulfide isomerase n=1 Tax=Edaphosphingomonas laterariae TaxID=861865 RepID=A0A239DMP4_9SPHN|nr:thioredoxin domain-containing protein [Sphingomonas laterariae]SNS33321.1 Protein-disulfide isomerase [Sphingomonas laterariae]
MRMISAAIAVLAVATATALPAAQPAPKAAPKAANAPAWNNRVVATAEGGWLIGNPAAPVKLIEYASYTCPHCAHFAAEGLPIVRRDYIATGKVSLEFRQFALNPIDLTEGMLVRCTATPGAAVAMGEKLFADQQKIMANAPDRAAADKLNATPEAQIHVALAQMMHLDDWAIANGLPAARANACLANLKLRDQIVAIRGKAVETYNIQGTPSFVINGKVLDRTFDWQALEPQLKAAVAGK